MTKQKIKEKVLEKLGNYEKYLNHSSKVREVIDLTIQQTAKEIFDDIENLKNFDIRATLPETTRKHMLEHNETIDFIIDELKKKWIE